MSALTTLAEILDDAWMRLEQGVQRRDDAFHLGVLATTGSAGPEARYVVLRHADRARGELQIHTDRRAPKLSQIARDPRVAWVGFGDEVQVRGVGRATIHHDDAWADAAWNRTALSSRRCYLADTAPGSVLTEPRRTLPDALLQRRPQLDETLPGREHFAVIRIELDLLDWLRLDAHGHRRARFERAGGHWSGHWIAP